MRTFLCIGEEADVDKKKDDPAKRIRLLFVRHTETHWNSERIYSGQSDIPWLSEKGVAQAKALAFDLRPFVPVAAIYSSDLTRTRQTAGIIGYYLGIEPQLDRRLREVHYGKLEGMSRDAAGDLYPEPTLSIRHPNFDFRPLGGESRAEVVARHLDFLNACALRHGASKGDPPRVVVVGHGGSLRALPERFGMGKEFAQGAVHEHLYEYTLQG